MLPTGVPTPWGHLLAGCAAWARCLFQKTEPEQCLLHWAVLDLGLRDLCGKGSPNFQGWVVLC